MDYYQFLKVERDAGADAIEAAVESVAAPWRVLQSHHDVKVAERARRTLAQIEEARATLLDPVKRAAYDQALGPAPAPPPATGANAARAAVGGDAAAIPLPDSPAGMAQRPASAPADLVAGQVAGPARALVGPMRALLVVASFLVLIAGVQLFIFSDYTAALFAWTIRPSLTAAFLGAAYWASFVLELLAARERRWASARIAVPAVFLFTLLTLMTTLLHLDRFHLNDPSWITRGATYVWIAIYATVPPLMVVALVLQYRAPGSDPPRTAPLPLAARIAPVLQGIILFSLGAGLLAVPELIARIWPWMLTALTGRAIGAWLLSLGFAAFHAARENDWLRIRLAMGSYLILAALQLLALARYPATVDWHAPGGWLYLLFLGSVLVLGLYGLRQSWRAVAAARTT